MSAVIAASYVDSTAPAGFLQQKYNNNGISSTTQTVTLDAAVSSGQTAVAIIYEYPAGASVTSISGLGATWTQAVRISNAGNIAMSVWVGAGCTSGSSITTTSGAGQTNEVNLSTWSNLTGTIVGSASSQNMVQTTLLTGSRAPGATGRLIIGGVITNTTPTMTWTDSPAAWTALTGGTDMFPAYRVATSTASHSRSGSASVAANYCGTAVEVS